MSWKRIAGVTMLAFGLGITAQARDQITPPLVPSTLEPPAGVRLFFAGHAAGTQNYICAPASTATGVDWLFLGPQATVFDDKAEQTLTHFLSKNPYQNGELHATWQHSRDSSGVWAKKLRGSTDPIYVAPDAVEWLLLEVTGAQVGPTSGDKLATARFIQRVNTVGGIKPPAADCTAATINTRRLVSYEADYYFYR
jgi:hypothetical protein